MAKDWFMSADGRIGGLSIGGKLKKAIVALLFTAVTAGSAFALDWKSYPDAIANEKLQINLGVGFGTPLYGEMVIPPLSISVDYALPIGGLPFTIGAMFGFTTSKYEFTNINWGTWETYKDEWKYTGMAFAARFGYHPNFEVKNLDAYVNLSLGYYLFGSDVSGATNFDTFFFSGNIGVRYFFTKNIGAFAELGYSALSYVTAGLSVKL